MANDAPPAFILEIDQESGEVAYSSPQLNQAKYMLSSKDEVLEIMADFLAQHDFDD